MKKKEKIVAHLEPSIYKAAKIVMDKEDLSGSAFARKCIINDLVNRGLLTKDMLIEIAG